MVVSGPCAHSESEPRETIEQAGLTAQMLWIVIMLHGKASEKRTGSVILRLVGQGSRHT
jgi:hypothetical protein